MVPLNVNDFEEMARRKLPKALYEYIASGTDDEQSLRENRAAFKRWFLRPRVLVPVVNLSTRTNIFGHDVDMPVFASPAGVQALCDPQHGECATARACARSQILFGLSQHATRSIEQVADAGASCLRFYQVYILRDRNVTCRLIQRALQAGYQGIFLTVDSVRFGYREADARNGFNALPPPHRLVNYDEPTSSLPSSHMSRQKKLDETYNARQHKAWDQNSELMFEQNVTWGDVRWVKDQLPAGIPVIVKGVMTAEDAVLALQAGADGIMVSNHGGRQLDSCLAPIDVLPEVVAAVAGRVPVWLDGGVRRGTDVVKALALGASAVGMGKPLFYALAVGGENAVVEMLALLKREIEAAMALCGCESISDITSNHVSRHPHCKL